MIDISVIIPTYNVAPYVRRAIDSALRQERVKLEVIVVDDCSTDDTWTIVSAIADPRIRTRRNHENCGPSVSRNEGIAMAAGQWIAVLDGDDEFLPGRLCRCLDRAKAENAAIVVDNIEVRREADGKTFPMFSPVRLAKMGHLTLAQFIAGNRLLKGGYSLGYLKPLFSAEFLRQHNLAYDASLRIGEDYLLLAEALAKGAICAVEPIQGYAYTVRAGSTSHRLGLNDIERMAASDEKFFTKYALDEETLKAQWRRSTSLKEAYYFTTLVSALKRKDVAATIKAMATCPGAVYQLWRPVVARLQRLRKRGR
jgi:succinoglycan biosynthesis protein ExoO